jgi:uncharacterized protein YjbI with pentapeptide repeats
LNWINDWFADFSGELVGAFLATLIFGLIVTVAQSSQQEKAEKTRLIIQLGSESNNITLLAAEELLARDWLRDGTLRGASFIGANLQGRFLKGADLEAAYLNWANLKGVSLMSANLKNANFFSSNLCGALLIAADMGNSRLEGADLREAGLNEANLAGAYLFHSDLRNATFVFTRFDEKTTLPDGSHLDFTRPIDEQLDVFTNPNNPNFIPFFDPYNPDEVPANPNCKQYRPFDLPR